MQGKIEKIRFAGFGLKFAEEVLAEAQAKANASKGIVYICNEPNCISYVYHEFHTMADDVITFVEPA
jgi:enhancing lycopene biosynthesis protein 2